MYAGKLNLRKSVLIKARVWRLERNAVRSIRFPLNFRRSMISGHGIVFVTKRKRSRWPLYLYIYKDIEVRFAGSGGRSGKEWKMMRRRTVINAKIPKPNRNVTMTVGNKTVVDAVFADTGLNVFLDPLKRSQGKVYRMKWKRLFPTPRKWRGFP